ncbi:DUF6230 family protein [Actinocorallia longicatena]|uniref:DUF6230 family protein n=1 Tax=Actinocorallia longicatena TaxID=111803 RepID=A0ABP6QI37_9ACTN
MSDSPTTGKVSWKRFAAVMVPSTLAVGALVFGTASGAIAATFAVSGNAFKVSADKIEADGFTQYGSAVQKGDGTLVPVTNAVINQAKITKMCQSVTQDFFGKKITLRLEAGPNESNKVVADHLTMGIDSLKADAVFSDIKIGMDASKLDAAKIGDGGKWDAAPVGQAGAFGQQATSAVLTKVQQSAWSTTAGTFNLKGLTMSFGAECY